MSDNEEGTEALAAQIAAMQAKMDAIKAKKEKERRKREEEDAQVLVHDTPTKASSREEKDRRSYFPPADQPNFVPKKPVLVSENRSRAPNPAPPPEPARSSMASRLAAMKHSHSSGSSRSASAAPSRMKEPSTRPSPSRYPAPAPSSARSSSSSVASPSLSKGSTASKRRTDDLQATLAQDQYAKKKKPAQTLPSLPARKGFSYMRDAPTGNNMERSSAPSKTSARRPNPAPYPSAASRSQAKRERSPSLEVDDKTESFRRDDVDSTLIEKLEKGPKQFPRDPEGDNEWVSVEPNSGIRLKKRTTPHEEVQEFLTGRYYLPPSKLYSVARLTRDGTSYDIPVDDEWLTIAVVAQRGPIRVSGTKVKREKGSDDEKDEDDESGGEIEESEDDEDDGEQAGDFKPFIGTDGKAWKPKPKKRAKKSKEDGEDDWKKKREPRKYINLTLCAMPRRKYGSTTSTGDVLLQMLLFEADHVVTMENGEGGIYKSYRGGSGGAYEKWCNIAEGSVIAILNPRVWRNLRGGSNKPHPMESPLGLNPFTDDSIMHIGYSRDLGHCSAVQRDGNRCRTWVDTRLNSVCEYHLHAAVKRGKGGRGEFTASTSEFKLTSTKNKVGNAPRKGKTGLLPAHGRIATPRGREDGGGGATYVVGGGVIHTGGALGDENVTEKLGRGRAGRLRRKEEQKQAERDLEKLFEREKAIGGGGTTGGQYLNVIKRYDGKMKEKDDKDEKKEEEEEKKRVFSAEAIKRIGFDPSARVGQLTKEEDQQRIQSITTLEGLSARGTRDFCAKGKKVENAEPTRPLPQTAIPFPHAPAKPVVPDDEDEMIDLDD
ncbi:hypothetical protein IAR50_004957 [Cryptococcus sp. DSM 104548]